MSLCQRLVFCCSSGVGCLSHSDVGSYSRSRSHTLEQTAGFSRQTGRNQLLGLSSDIQCRVLSLYVRPSSMRSTTHINLHETTPSLISGPLRTLLFQNLKGIGKITTNLPNMYTNLFLANCRLNRAAPLPGPLIGLAVCVVCQAVPA